MDEPRKYKEFINANKEVFQLLSQKIKSLDTVMGVQTLQDLKGRQNAIRIINEWMTDLWGIAYNDLPKPEEDEDLIRTI